MGHYMISKWRAQVRNRIAKRTRRMRYGKQYMSDRGIQNVTRNLIKAQRIRLMKVRRHHG